MKVQSHSGIEVGKLYRNTKEPWQIFVLEIIPAHSWPGLPMCKVIFHNGTVFKIQMVPTFWEEVVA